MEQFAKDKELNSLRAENLLLRQILEQLLKIDLIPKIDFS